MNLETSLIYFVNDGILAGKTPATMKGYQYSLNSLVKYTRNQFIPQQVQEIKSEIIIPFFIEGRKIKKWNQYTYWTHYKNLNVYFNWCIKKNYITENPLKDIPKPKMPQQMPKSLTEKEAMQLMRAVASLPTDYSFTKARNKALVATFMFTGIRKNELMNLRVSDVDLENDFIYVEKGKGGKRREIPIEESILKPILLEYHEHRIRLCKDSQWFFNGTFSGRGDNDNKIGISTVDRLLRRLGAICKRNVSAHKLRHTFATLLLDKTGDIYTLKELMGHADIKTTCVYLSSTRRKKVEVISKMKIDFEQ